MEACYIFQDCVCWKSKIFYDGLISNVFYNSLNHSLIYFYNILKYNKCSISNVILYVINILEIGLFCKIPCKKSFIAWTYLSDLVLSVKLLTEIIGDAVDTLFGLKTIPLEKFYLIFASISITLLLINAILILRHILWYKVIRIRQELFNLKIFVQGLAMKITWTAESWSAKTWSFPRFWKVLKKWFIQLRNVIYTDLHLYRKYCSQNSKKAQIK